MQDASMTFRSYNKIHVNKFGAKIYAEAVAHVLANVLEGLINFCDQKPAGYEK